MANLGKKNGVYLARFRFQGKEYKKSLKTSDRKAAEGAMHRVEDALHRLAIGLLTVPAGVDPGDFIISGGTFQPPSRQEECRASPTLQAVVAEYLDNLYHLAESNRYTIGVHLRHLWRKLGAKMDAPIDQIVTGDLDGFLQARLKERSHTTVKKERDTVVQLFDWAVARKYLAESPTAELTKIKEGADPDPFRTLQEIEATLARGGLTHEEVLEAWDRLYLAPQEIAGLLATVRARSKHEVSFILHAVPAYTGVRRGEVLRLRWSDVEFDQDSLVARSRKQSRQTAETKRRIDLHPELKAGWASDNCASTVRKSFRHQRRGASLESSSEPSDPLSTRWAS